MAQAQNPGGITTAPQLWLKGSNGTLNSGGTATANGGTISTWQDQSGNGNNATATNTPTLSTNAIAGYSAVYITTNNNLLVSAFSSIAMKADSTVFAVFKPTTLTPGGTSATSNALLSKDAGAASAGAYYLNYSSAGHLDIDRPYQVAGTAGTGTLVAGNWTITESKISGTGVTHYIGTSSAGLSSAGSSTLVVGTTEPSTPLRIGWFTAGTPTNYPTMYLAELIVYNSALSSGDETAIKSSLTAKYFPTATAYNFVGPTNGATGVASGTFTLTPNNPTSGPDTVNFSDGGAGGTFTPTSLSFASGATTGQTFTYTPSIATTATITPTSSTLGLTFSPTTKTYSSTTNATSYTASLSASTGNIGVPVTITLTPNGATTNTVTIAESGVAGTLSTQPVTLNGTTPVTATFTPSASGIATFTFTNNSSGVITDPGTLMYTVAAARSAQNWYFSNSGNDSTGTGSIGNPYATITKANSLSYVPGDQILFNGGQTFSGNFVLANMSGSASLPIVVGNYGTGNAVISAATGDGVLIQDCAYVTVQGITATGITIPTNGQMTSHGSGIHVLSDITQAAGGTTYYNGILVQNCSVGGFYWGINVEDTGGNANTNGTTNTLIGVGYSGLKLLYDNVTSSSREGIYVHGSTGTAFSTPGTHGTPGTVGDPSLNLAKGRDHYNVLVDHCTTTNTLGDSSLTDTSGIACLNGSGIIVTNSTLGMVNRCTNAYDGVNNAGAFGGPVGIWMCETNNGVIQYCEAYGGKTTSVDGGAYDLDGGCQNCIIQYCWSHDNYGPAWQCGMYPGSNTNNNNVFRYNISQNDSRFNYGVINLFNNNYGAWFYNNTIYVTPSGMTHTGPLCAINPTPTTGAPNGQTYTSTGGFYNNVIITTGGVRYLGGTNTMAFSRNLWYASGSTGALVTPPTADTLALTGNPNLLSVGTGGIIGNADNLNTLTAYDPTSSSPGVGAGINLLNAFGTTSGLNDYNFDLYGNQIMNDFHGNIASVGGKYDIGAVERQTASGGLSVRPVNGGPVGH